MLLSMQEASVVPDDLCKIICTYDKFHCLHIFSEDNATCSIKMGYLLVLSTMNSRYFSCPPFRIKKRLKVMNQKRL